MNIKCFIVGGGFCGLCIVIEFVYLGVKVVVVEKRDFFFWNNVLYFWFFIIYDFCGLGVKKFYGKFCVGFIDYISIC